MSLVLVAIVEFAVSIVVIVAVVTEIIGMVAVATPKTVRFGMRWALLSRFAFGSLRFPPPAIEGVTALLHSLLAGPNNWELK